MLEITRGLPGYALQLSVLQQDPDYTSFPQPRRRSNVEPLDYIQTARINAERHLCEEYWKATRHKSTPNNWLAAAGE